VKRWSVWCQPKDGSDNGQWIGERYFGLRTYTDREAVEKELARKVASDRNWHYEIREYQMVSK
jgi:hypothetical protein